MAVDSVAVVGAGSWGTALAKHLGEVGVRVRLWSHDPSISELIRQKGQNAVYLPDVPLPQTVIAGSRLEETLAGVEAAVVAVPSHVFREVLVAARPSLSPGCLVVSASKGVEEASLRTMSGVVEDVLGPGGSERVAVLSGPSFAKEVAVGVPTAVTAAAHNGVTARQVQDLFTARAFRVYTSSDVVGVELGGAVKNVIAIAAGVSDGLGFGHNTRAALITRGLAEISRLASRLGADPQTLSGLSGLGDLVLTCTGDLSRNRQVGLRLGRGESLKEILGGMKMVAEGVRNTRSVYGLAASVGADVPITEQMHALLYEAKAPRDAVRDLLGRDPKPEFYS